MVRCSKCKRAIISETKYQDWLGLMNFIEFLYGEGSITEYTYKSMSDKLMTFKRFADDKKN